MIAAISHILETVASSMDMVSRLGRWSVIYELVVTFPRSNFPGDHFPPLFFADLKFGFAL